jgi:cytochrome P450
MRSDTNPFDIFSLQAQGNHLLYEQMRLEDPVHRATEPVSGKDFWFLTRYEDCVSFMKDKRFGKEAQKRLDPSRKLTSNDIINQHMLNLDEPDHNRLKSLVHKAFSPSRVQKMRTSIQVIAHKLLAAIDEEVADGAEFDLSERYTDLLPLLALAEMLGIPDEDFGQFKAWTMAMLLNDETASQEAVMGFSMYLNQQIELRHTNPSQNDDLLTALIFAEDEGQKLSRQEVLAMIFLLLAAGHETMVNFLANAVLMLMNHPKQMELLVDNLNNTPVIKSAIEEMLRYKSPSYMSLPSWAFEDVEIGGKMILQGDTVHAVLHAANHDPAMFLNPQVFDILREPNKHIAFSQGIHHCLGAPLARLEGEIAIVSLLRWMPSL